MCPREPIRRASARALLCVLLVAWPAPGLGSAPGAAPPEPDPGFPLLLHADAGFYANNLEYFNPFEDGKTFFGAQTSLYFTVDRPAFDLSLGVFLKREFGDEDALSDVLPLFRFRYKTPWCKLILGFLDSSDNHGLPEALLAQQYPFYYPVEEGAQFLARGRRLRADAWINWYLLNTPEHREFFAAGVHGAGSWRFLSCELGLRITHHGGQEYRNGRVSHDLAGTVRCTLSERWDALDADFGAALSAYGSQWVEKGVLPGGGSQTVAGYGGEAEVFFAPWGWKLYYRLYGGRDLIVEQGDPLYRTGQPMHRFGVRKRLSINHMVRARLQLEGVVIENGFDYNYLVVVDVFLDLFLHRFAGHGG